MMNDDSKEHRLYSLNSRHYQTTKPGEIKTEKPKLFQKTLN